ncbi:MAG: hypothetical protein ACM3MF_03705 [Anaerolineae bacterium]
MHTPHLVDHIRRVYSALSAALTGHMPRDHSAARSSFGASAVTDANIGYGLDWSGLYRDRYHYDREKVQAEALLAWRLNPLARRIVELQTHYVTDGIDFECDDPATERFLKEFWNHPLNKVGEHLREWADELALTGNLFPCITTDRAGMSYLRIFPTDMIQEIDVAPNDVQQERAFTPKATAGNNDPAPVPCFWHNTRSKTVMLHYAVNKLAGMLWGEPDIAPLLPWLARYAGWLEDRVRLNKFRQSYLFVVKGHYESQQAKEARQRQLSSSPPNPGSILVTDASEEWGVIHPQLDSFEANSDGLALKKFIAGGRGYPLHWLAEPESSTRTTAEAAGTPTFKSLEARQRLFTSMLQDILKIVVQRRFQRGGAVKPDAAITVRAADISERDNASLALASTQVIASFGQLWANGFISDDEYLRVAYRFAGEVLPAARPDNPAARTRPGARANPAYPYVKTNAATGEVRTKEPQ